MRKEIKMNKHKFPILAIAFVIVAVSFLAGYQIGGHQNSATASAHESNTANQAGISYNKGSLTSLNADDALAYRWLGIARFYAKDPYIGADLTGTIPLLGIGIFSLAISSLIEK